ncbi:polysaccharide deacetylase family protein [Haloarcula nitratireducens]|uniref:Polysaccharide deacetylase family protein n=1 Tax=Haloarcula nitratireducens TaxID=2487749 RepID=A0AAW4PAF3_9EURY|nr:polysaccharide deacetylase family protein [Halomicroarcula nitratireducens]MBX0294859.1 polysaccharide deacetylase family protein [Halomicroarcula nitratireducens]
MTDSRPTSRRSVLKGGTAALALALGGSRIGRVRADHEHPLLTTAFDSRDRYGESGDVLDDFEDLDEWTADSGTLEASTDVVYEGSQSAKLSLSPESSDGSVEIVREFDGLDLSDRDLSIAIRLVRPEVEQLTAVVEDDDGDSVTMDRRTISPTYGWFRSDLGVSDESGDPDLSEVEEIRLRFDRDVDSPITAYLDELRTTERTEGGRVVLTFDDGGITQYTRALPVLESYDFPALTAVNPGRADEDDYLGEDEMREMRDEGWEIGSHTFDHERLTDLSDEEAREQVRDAKEWLLDRGFEVGSSMFVYPWSSNSPRIRDIVSEYHYLAFTDGSIPHGAQLTGPLTTGRIFGENLERLESVLDLAEKYGQTAVVSYHEIGADTGWVSQADFEETMAGIERRDLDVIPASEMLTELIDPPVEEIRPKSIREAVARDGGIELADAQRAVRWNREESYVPQTNGKRLDDETLTAILDGWEGET